MSSEFVTLGHEAKVRVNGGNVLAVVGGTITLEAQEHDTSDTEGDGFEDAKCGLRKATVELECQHAKDVNPWAAPLLCGEGDIIALEVYPHGTDFDPFVFPLFLCTTGTLAFPLRSPESLRIRGRSKRNFFRPGEI